VGGGRKPDGLSAKAGAVLLRGLDPWCRAARFVSGGRPALRSLLAEPLSAAALDSAKGYPGQSSPAMGGNRCDVVAGIRQLEGIAKAKEAGVYKGRPASMGAAHVRKLKSEGLGPSKIAKALGIGRASVYRALAPAAGEQDAGA
jgi:hypothetical protein